MTHHNDQYKRDYEAGQRAEENDPNGIHSYFGNQAYQRGIRDERNRQGTLAAGDAAGTVLGYMIILPIAVLIEFIRLVWHYPRQMILLFVLTGVGIGLFASWQTCGWLDASMNRTGCRAKIGVDASQDAAFSPDGKMLAIASQTSFTIHNVEDGQTLAQVSTGINEIDYIKFAPDGKLLAVKVGGGVKFYNNNGSPVNDIGNPAPSVNVGYVSNFAFSPDGQVLASVSVDSVVLWYLAEQRYQELHLSGLPITYPPISISRNGVVSTVLEGGIVQMWNIADGQPLRTMQLTEEVHDMVLSADGQSVFVSVGSQGDLHVEQRSISDGAVIKTFKGEQWIGERLALSPDEQVLATWGNGPLRFWRVSDGRVLNSVDLQAYVAFSPDGHLIASQLRGGRSVALWNVPKP
jgi:WD40 repeat protein